MLWGSGSNPTQCKRRCKASKEDLFARNRRSCQARISFLLQSPRTSAVPTTTPHNFLLQRKRHWTESQSTGPRANERKRRRCEVDASQAHAVQRQGEQDLETDSDVAAQANATDFDVAAQANATDLRYAREHEFFMRVGRRQRRRETP